MCPKLETHGGPDSHPDPIPIPSFEDHARNSIAESTNCLHDLSFRWFIETQAAIVYFVSLLVSLAHYSSSILRTCTNS